MQNFIAYTLFMRIILQRVTKGSVTVEGEETGSIGAGYVLLVGIMEGDTAEQGRWLAEKITRLRLFDGEDGKINDRSVIDIGGNILAISQFTLAADTGKGNRPDYTAAAATQEARMLYEHFIADLRELGVARVETGRFGAHMMVELSNNGPVTLILERSAGAA